MTRSAICLWQGSEGYTICIRHYGKRTRWEERPRVRRLWWRRDTNREYDDLQNFALHSFLLGFMQWCARACMSHRISPTATTGTTEARISALDGDVFKDRWQKEVKYTDISWSPCYNPRDDLILVDFRVFSLNRKVLLYNYFTTSDIHTYPINFTAYYNCERSILKLWNEYKGENTNQKKNYFPSYIVLGICVGNVRHCLGKCTHTHERMHECRLHLFQKQYTIPKYFRLTLDCVCRLGVRVLTCLPTPHIFHTEPVVHHNRYHNKVTLGRGRMTDSTAGGDRELEGCVEDINENRREMSG